VLVLLLKKWKEIRGFFEMQKKLVVFFQNEEIEIVFVKISFFELFSFIQI
jgi:hypothetical protein